MVRLFRSNRRGGWSHGLTVLIVGAFLVSGARAGREPSALSKELVGRRIVVPFDMPIHSRGVDFDGSDGFRRDDASRIERLKTWGTSFRAGDTATVTEVRVGRKRIELILGAGGLSTTALMTMRDSRFNAISDPATQRDPGPHTAQREAEQTEQDQSMVTNELGPTGSRVEIMRVHRTISDTTGATLVRRWSAAAVYLPEAGSRLRVDFPQGIPKEVLEPAVLIEALSEHVIFVGTR